VGWQLVLHAIAVHDEKQTRNDYYLGASRWLLPDRLIVNRRVSMSIERAMFAFGGVMVMLTSLLALFHHPNWTWFTLFIGFNCLQSSFTGFCPPTWVMKKFGMKTEAQLALEKTG